MSYVPVEVRQRISDHLDAISKEFKQPVVTLLVRSPHLEDGDFMLTQEKHVGPMVNSLLDLMAKQGR